MKSLEQDFRHLKKHGAIFAVVVEVDADESGETITVMHAHNLLVIQVAANF